MNGPDLSQLGLSHADASTDIGICVFDDHARFLYMNEAFLKIRQGTMDQQSYQSTTVYDMLNGNLVDKCIIDSVYQKKVPITDVQTVFGPDGSVLRKQLVTIYPIFDDNGNTKNAIAYYRDLSTFQASEQALQASASNPAQVASDMPTDPDVLLDSGEDSGSIVLASPSMRTLYRAAKEIAATDSTVLITGETGTGKEVLARYIHNHSPRANQEMVVVDCTSLPDSLMESELFGYEKGSFTGASAGKMGLIESADGTTLFLDELNSLPLPLQGKLLRTIETKSVKRLGALKSRRVDFRLIVATNADLLQCVKEKIFRPDLYYRINVIPFELPPLRTRREDIIPTAQYFVRRFSKRYNVQRNFSQKTFQALEDCPWDGNVRELRNFIERLVIMGEDSNVFRPSAIPVTLFPQSAPTSEPAPSQRMEQLDQDEVERQSIQTALEENGFHREKTAQALNISRRTLQYKLKKYDLL